MPCPDLIPALAPVATVPLIVSLHTLHFLASLPSAPPAPPLRIYTAKIALVDLDSLTDNLVIYTKFR